jgi:3-isopropylmalate dehydrogenase
MNSSLAETKRNAVKGQGKSVEARIVVLPGDGIGPEVVAAARSVLDAVAWAGGHHFEYDERLIGGCAIDAHGVALPAESLQACQSAEAVLLGAVGGPRWDDPSAAARPEQGLLGLRKALDLYANLRPVQLHPALVDASPLKPDRLEGVDLLVVRELTSGIYFGQPSERRWVDGEQQAVDTMSYTESEIRRVTQLAFQLARGRRRKVSSVDKANVLESSRLWRQTVSAVAQSYPDVAVEHVLVDAAAMFLVTRPATFDVILTSNMFGDILTDEASVLSGSMGNLPSASLGERLNRMGKRLGLYEPIHGSAPDIAGSGIANPIGAILSVALMLRYSLGLEAEAHALEAAVYAALAHGARTRDLARPGDPVFNTQEMADAICAEYRPEIA